MVAVDEGAVEVQQSHANPPIEISSPFDQRMHGECATKWKLNDEIMIQLESGVPNLA